VNSEGNDYCALCISHFFKENVFSARISSEMTQDLNCFKNIIDYKHLEQHPTTWEAEDAQVLDDTHAVGCARR
jgi:hypothetical protein